LSLQQARSKSGQRWWNLVNGLSISHNWIEDAKLKYFTAKTETVRVKRGCKANQGRFQIEAFRDRHGTFEPQRIKKRRPRLEGFDDKGLLLYARVLSTHDIQGQLEELCGAEVSPTLISSVTEAAGVNPGLTTTAESGKVLN